MRYTNLFFLVLMVAVLFLFGPGTGTVLADNDLDLHGIIQSVGSDNGTDSLIVNSIVFYVDSSTEIRGEHHSNLSFSDLAAGQMVEVRADLAGDGNYWANEIRVESDHHGEHIEVRGAIVSLLRGSVSDTISVRGYTILVDDNTEFQAHHNNSYSRAAMQQGDVVEVKAVQAADGWYWATRVKLENENHDDDFEVTGLIDSVGVDFVDVAGNRFKVTGETVIEGHHHSALTFADLAAGMLVEIHAALAADGSYTAVRIKVESEDHENEIEFYGAIDSLGTDYVSVDGLAVFVTESTVIEGHHHAPLSFTDLTVGMLVEIKAVMNGDQVVALRIKVEDHGTNDEIELTGAIESVSGDTLRVAGVDFITDSATVVLNHHRLPIALSDLQAGMTVEVKAIPESNGGWYAVRIKVEDFWRHELEFTGAIESVGSDWINVTGRQITVTDSTVIRTHMNQPASFSDLTVGTMVEVHARLQADSSLTATRIHIEDGQELRVTGTVDVINGDTLVVGGMDFITESTTLYFDLAHQPISFPDITTGMVVEVKAYLAADGYYHAVRVKIEDDPSMQKVTGMITMIGSNWIGISNPNFAVNTATVILNEQFQPIAFSELLIGQTVTLWADAAMMAVQIHKTTGTTTGLENNDLQALPQSFVLGANYPNPFNPTTTIPLAISGSGVHNVELTVFNLLGQRVATVFNGQLPAGEYRFVWDGSTEYGQHVTSGIYFYRVTVGNDFTAVRRMILIK